ncbi:PRTRC system ThiF family protein [Reinekea sp. G2M2-21]|uniref:PRTRC system ThiF family protein n=1 Tax=Reinekea sp. G2M2-21 TaxID=2788942 RepID=UPI0018AC5FB2|nr:PRTRC system ThiF family protein [Reinekea sp. G2M2-21]
MKEFTFPPSWVNGLPLTVWLIGAGGTGSEMLDQLFRMDVSLQMLNHPGLRIVVFDDDTVSEWNLGRQRFWPVDVGANKAEVLAGRYQRHWPNARVYGNAELFEGVFEYENCRTKPNLIVTCVDSGQWRFNMAKEFAELQEMYVAEVEAEYHEELLWLDCGNDRNTGQVILGHLLCPLDRERLPNVADLYPSLEHSEDRDEDSCSAEEAFAKQDFGINSQMAVSASGLIWQLIRTGKLTNHGCFIDRADLSTQALPISNEQWRLFGYVA